jgi:hypothetical protein
LFLLPPCSGTFYKLNLTVEDFFFSTVDVTWSPLCMEVIVLWSAKVEPIWLNSLEEILFFSSSSSLVKFDIPKSSFGLRV